MSAKSGGEILQLTAEKRQRAQADRQRLRALQIRSVQSVKAQGGIAHLAKRLNADVASAAKPMPRVQELNDDETNHHYLELQCQRYKLLEREMTEEEFEARKAQLRQQAEDLMKGKTK